MRLLNSAWWRRKVPDDQPITYGSGDDARFLYDSANDEYTLQTKSAAGAFEDTLRVGSNNDDHQVEWISRLGVILSRYQENATGASFTNRKARGTEASPTALSDNDFLGEYNFHGHDGTNFAVGAKFRARAEEAWTATERGTEFLIETTEIGSSAPVLRVRVRHSGEMNVARSITVGSPTGGDKGVGSINAKAVYDDNVQIAAPDYVFESDYSYMPIKSMVSYAKKEKHLPTIPSAKEIQKNHRPLGVLFKDLWKTAEIQALYIGELEERLKDLETHTPGFTPKTAKKTWYRKLVPSRG